VERGSYAVQVAKRIHAALSQPFGPRGREINIGASIGIVLKGESYDLPENILRDADTAMYKAKANRRIYYKVFSHKMREETLKTIALETDLRQGIKDGEFYVAYQPVISVDTGKPHGFEALLRWNRAGSRSIGPASFIPMAEETGLIRALGLYVIEEVCKQFMEWKKLYSHPFITHLNVSGHQLAFPSFPREVQDILDRTGADPSWLLFEITESVLLDNDGGCIQGINHLRELGITFCLDDFGTGFSSISYLRQLPLSCIKIDRSFVSDLETDAHSLAIVRNLLSLGKDLGLSVIVEGIERQSQAERLMSVGCALMQGFHFYQPLDVDKAAELLR
jgi:EAL domain-containing protein (putative c-di-GMP-specific phosphodiesterase class I)